MDKFNAGGKGTTEKKLLERDFLKSIQGKNIEYAE
jgi:hypothetical protein